MADTPYQFGASDFGDNPYVFGQADPSAVDPTMSGTGNGMNYAGIAKALQGLQGGQQQAQKPAVPNLPGQSGVAPGGIQAQSGAYSGNAASMNALVQMLMQRAAAYRAASNPSNAQPVNLQSQQRPQGLLGL